MKGMTIKAALFKLRAFIALIFIFSTTFPLASTNKAIPSALVACTRLNIFGTFPTPNGTSSKPRRVVPLTLIVEVSPVVPVVNVKLLVLELYLTVTPPTVSPVLGSTI